MSRTEESHELGHWVHRSLLAGLTLSGLLMIGGFLRVLSVAEPRPEGTPAPFLILLDQAAHGDGIALMNLGLLALMATPVLRVVVLAAGWGWRREWRFLAVSLTVLALLGISMVLGVR
jgi:hypothetical protein